MAAAYAPPWSCSRSSCSASAVAGIAPGCEGGLGAPGCDTVRTTAAWCAAAAGLGTGPSTIPGTWARCPSMGETGENALGSVARTLACGCDCCCCCCCAGGWYCGGCPSEPPPMLPLLVCAVPDDIAGGCTLACNCDAARCESTGAWGPPWMPVPGGASCKHMTV